MPKHTIPEFIIDLNLAPEDRFVEVGHYYGSHLGVFLAEMRSSFTAEILSLLEPAVSTAGEILGLAKLLLRSGLPFPSLPLIPSKAVPFLLEIAGVNSLEGVLNAALDASLWTFSKTLAAHEYMRELEGLAVAANVDVKDLLLGNLLYDFSAGFKLPGVACTGFVHGGPKSPLIARSMDWNIPEGIGAWSTVLRYQGGGSGEEYEILTLGFPGFNGIISGLSSEGVAITVNQRTQDEHFMKLPNWATPTLWRVREVLEGSADYASAYDMITEEVMASPAFFLICGKEPGESCLVMSDGANQEHVDVSVSETQAISNHVPGGCLPEEDFEDATSEERFAAMYLRAEAMRTADINSAKRAIGKWPVECDRTVQQMVLCPAKNELHLRCRDISNAYELFKTTY